MENGRAGEDGTKTMFAEALARAETDEERAEIWHAMLEGSKDVIDAEADRVRRLLHESSGPYPLIEYVNESARFRAEAAARAIHPETEEFPPQQ